MADLKIFTASDLHYLSHDLVTNKDSLAEYSRHGDGKILPYSEELLESFLAKVKIESPAALILTGDLSLNSEANSHEHLARALHKLRQEIGVKIFIIPGNHDLERTDALSFHSQDPSEIPGIRKDEFKRIYESFGPEGSLKRDPHSFSYLAEISPQLWLLMIDVNLTEHPGSLSNQTLDFIQSCLDFAAKSKVPLLCATHQTILVHNEAFTKGFLIENYQKLQDLLHRYHVPLNLAGHMHIQDIKTSEGGLTEICTGSLSVQPHHYGHLEIGDQLHYRAMKNPVSDWAKKQGLENQDLLAFEDYSKDYFKAIGSRQLFRELKKLELSPKEEQSLQDFTSKVNEAYFAGTLDEVLPNLATHPGQILLEEVGQSLSFNVYFKSFLDNAKTSQRSVTLPMTPPRTP